MGMPPTVLTRSSATELPMWYAMPPEEVAAQLETGAAGLSESEARARLERDGPNQLPEAPEPSALRVFLSQFVSPFGALLGIAAVVTTVLGDYIDAGTIAAVLLIDAIIGFIQERKAEQSVRSLARLLTPRARVLRGGEAQEIESRELVLGDVVSLETGTRVPADVRLASATTLLVDESLLTGESLPVVKGTAPLPAGTPVADRTNLVHAGTVVSSGRGWGYVVATGAQTELGDIATAVRQVAPGTTPLQRRMNRLARQLGVAVVISATLAFVVGVYRGDPPAEMFKVAVALAVAAVPEGLPLVFTIALAAGVHRMAGRRAIVRHLPAVETLGSTTVIGSDKTGTLTENRMTVTEIWTAGEAWPLPSAAALSADLRSQPPERRPLAMTLLAGVLANEASLVEADGQTVVRGDPTEGALLAVARKAGFDLQATRAAWQTVADVPFEPERRFSASIQERDGEQILFVKGAPERVFAMCASTLGPDGPAPFDLAQADAAAAGMALHGLRVLAMACRPLTADARLEEIEEPQEMILVGLQGMIDPARAGVREAIADCRLAGIRVVMITGDHAVTALAIARDLGIGGETSRVLTGMEVATMDAAALREAVAETPVYARIAPDQKLRVVQALQARGEIVAVTGDGVNDAPALRAADIGIAMGRGGTDVARESAEMVLADDNFVSIVAAVEEGRVTFDNVRRTTFFLVATGIAEVGVILGALALGLPLPLLPAQILWLNLVAEGLEDVALAFEPAEPGVLRRPPRKVTEGIISRLLWERTAISAAVMALGTLGMFAWELEQSGSLTHARTVALTTLVMFQVFQLGSVRSETLSIFRTPLFSNRFLLIATSISIGIYVAALYLPPTQFILRVVPLGWAEWGRILLVSLTIVVAMELHKFFRSDVRRQAPANLPDEPGVAAATP